MPDYPPYVNAYGGIPRVFSKIKEAAVPPKFSQDFMSTVLDLRSSKLSGHDPALEEARFHRSGERSDAGLQGFPRGFTVRRVMAQRLREARLQTAL